MARRGSKNTRALLVSRRDTLRKYQGNQCCWCGKPMQQTNRVKWDFETIEHLTPRSKGGTDAIENLALAHQRCNRLRGVQDREPLVRRIATR